MPTTTDMGPSTLSRTKTTRFAQFCADPDSSIGRTIPTVRNQRATYRWVTGLMMAGRLGLYTWLGDGKFQIAWLPEHHTGEHTPTWAAPVLTTDEVITLCHRLDPTLVHVLSDDDRVKLAKLCPASDDELATAVDAAVAPKRRRSAVQLEALLREIAEAWDDMPNHLLERVFDLEVI